MKLKGEKELLAEDLYRKLDNFYFEKLQKYTNYIKDRTLKNLDDIYESELDALIEMHTAVEVIHAVCITLYKMDFTEEELRLLTENFTITTDLINSIAELKDKINIYDSNTLGQEVHKLLLIPVAQSKRNDNMGKVTPETEIIM
jgi:hypothetical protein